MQVNEQISTRNSIDSLNFLPSADAECRQRVGLTRSTHDRRTALFGATSSFACVLVKDRCRCQAVIAAQLKEALAIRPHYWANYNVLGRFYFDRTRYDDAVEMFSKVVSLAPENLFGYGNLGGAYVQLGRYNDAIPILERYRFPPPE